MVGFPFDSQVTFDPETGDPQFDRAVSSQPYRKLLRELFTTGVMPNPSTNLQVSAGIDGMTVIVDAGFAVVDGGLCQETEQTTLEIPASDSSYNRIDTVVLRWDENVDVRLATLMVKSGTPAATPVRPALQRNNSIYEIGLADVYVTRGVSIITNDKIADTRYESERCGIVSSVSEWDTTTIYQQVQSDLAEFKSDEEADFLEWYDYIKDILDESTAGHLQNEIEDLQSGKVSVSDIINNLKTDATNKPLSATQGKVLREDITNKVEDGATATATRNAGEFIARNGVLYKVTSNIASGGAITEGVNVQKRTVGEELTQINSDLSWGNYTTSGYLTYRKNALFVELLVFASSITVPNTGVSLGTLPVGYRPKVDILGTLSGIGQDSAAYPVRIWIDLNGKVQCTSWAAVSLASAGFHCVFPYN